MLNLNRAQILGNLTRDPEMRFTPNGQAVSNFAVATNRRWKNQDGSAGEATEYHDVVVWGKQAESVSPMLKKGQPVFIEGRLQTRSWEGQDGAKRYKTEIVAESVIVLGSKGMSGSDNYAYENETNPVESISKSSSNKADTKGDIAQNANADDEIDIEEIPF
ncbi:MAG: Single-stranded DNA-binding protein [bacterium ADurb.Bin212]|nr:MAG: Single-stranded DNA-binding protein [bacterium ADurb.Bin212]